MLKGVYTAIITPFDEKGYIDEEGLRQLIRLQIEGGVDGIVVLGTTGEAPTLQHEEKERIISLAVQEIKGQIPLLVGTGSYCTRTTIEQTRQAETLGADGALVVTPYYNKPTQEGFYRHFEALCRATSLPICLYNIPGRTGQNLSTETTLRLFQDFPSIVSIKEASGNLSQMGDILAGMSQQTVSPQKVMAVNGAAMAGLVARQCSGSEADERIDRQSQPVAPELFEGLRQTLLSGDDNLTLPVVAMGGHGVVSVLSNLFPKEVKALVQAAMQGDFIQARALHFQLLPFFKAAFLETNPAPIKAMMSLKGLPAGPCRLPLCEVSSSTLNGLKELWSNATLT